MAVCQGFGHDLGQGGEGGMGGCLKCFCYDSICQGFGHDLGQGGGGRNGRVSGMFLL